MIGNPQKVLRCNRCGRSYVQNERFKGVIRVNDEDKAYDITSISLMGCRSIPINSVSVCDECLDDFLDWCGHPKKFLERPNPLYTKEYLEGDNTDE